MANLVLRDNGNGPHKRFENEKFVRMRHTKVGARPNVCLARPYFTTVSYYRMQWLRRSRVAAAMGGPL